MNLEEFGKYYFQLDTQPKAPTRNMKPATRLPIQPLLKFHQSFAGHDNVEIVDAAYFQAEAGVSPCQNIGAGINGNNVFTVDADLSLTTKNTKKIKKGTKFHSSKA